MAAPVAPANFKVIDKDKLRIQLEWSPATDDPPITGYDWRWREYPPVIPEPEPVEEGEEAPEPVDPDEYGWTDWTALLASDANTVSLLHVAAKERQGYEFELRAVRGAVKGASSNARGTTGEIRERRHRVYAWARDLQHSSAYTLHLSRGHAAMKEIDRFVCHVVKHAAHADGRQLLDADLWAIVGSHMGMDVLRMRLRLEEHRDSTLLTGWKNAKLDERLHRIGGNWHPVALPLAPLHSSQRQTDVDRLVLGG